MIAVIFELLLGKDIIYLDPEDTPIGFLNRLVGLGFELTDENIARIHYLHDPSPDDIDAAIKFAEANQRAHLSGHLRRAGRGDGRGRPR